MSDTVLHAPFAGWLDVLDEVPDPVFATRMMGDGVAIDPTEGVLRAPSDGIVASVPDSAHAITLRLDDGVELLLHIGLETVALAGRGFAPRVVTGQRVRRGEVLIDFDLDAVALGAKDLVTPILRVGDGAVEMIGAARLVEAGEPVARLRGGEAVAVADAGGAEHARSVTVTAPHGLHARPAARIVALLKPYACEVTITRGEHAANARSATALLALGARLGDTLGVIARGRDAAAALDALAAFAGERFGDPAGTAPEPPAATSGGGVCASPGLAIGRIRQFRAAAVTVRTESLGVAHETAELDRAIGQLSRSLGDSAIAEAHRAILDDPQLRGVAAAEIARGASAGTAWTAAIGRAGDALRTLDDPRLAERVADLQDLERGVLTALAGDAPAAPIALPPDTILVASDLLPSQFLALDRDRLAGICTAAGGPTAHVAILAAAAGVPMIVAAGASVLAIPDDTAAVLDADAPELIVAPDADRLALASEQLATVRAARTAAARDAHAPGRTADGVRIDVFANLGSAEDAGLAVAAGAEGCGLLRTEFLFLDRTETPGESEQRALYARIATTLGDRPLIVRTLDIGGDKPVPYLPPLAEENPALGRRGIRLSLARPDLLATQLRAILRGVPGAQCRIMLPMVNDVAELLAVRAELDRAAAEVGRTERVELGVMIETPAAAILADQLAEHADFLSVGTNDLTQYVLAADRGNAAVSGLVDALHPAVLRMIARGAEGARAHGRWLGVCGALASDPRATALLIGLGVTELSAVPAAVAAVKAAVRATTLADARDLAERALAATSAAAVRALLEGGR